MTRAISHSHSHSLSAILSSHPSLLVLLRSISFASCTLEKYLISLCKGFVSPVESWLALSMQTLVQVFLPTGASVMEKRGSIVSKAKHLRLPFMKCMTLRPGSHHSTKAKEDGTVQTRSESLPPTELLINSCEDNRPVNTKSLMPCLTERCRGRNVRTFTLSSPEEMLPIPSGNTSWSSSSSIEVTSKETRRNQSKRRCQCTSFLSASCVGVTISVCPYPDQCHLKAPFVQSEDCPQPIIDKRILC